MGEFTQNLLKLTEFPFSYSLLGLITLILGKGLDPEHLTFATIGPLLILMGFLATTLSICDPIGAIQRSIIKGRKLHYSENRKPSEEYLSYYIFGKWIFEFFPSPYFFAIAFSPSEIIQRYRIVKGHSIDWEPVKAFYSELAEFSREKLTGKQILFAKKLSDVQKKWLKESKFRTLIFLLKYYLHGGLLRDINKDFKLIDEYSKLYQTFGHELDKINKYDAQDNRDLFEGLKKQTVKTKWITAEVDRITALFYFIIIISIFIFAIKYVPDFVGKFAQPFGNIELTHLHILLPSVVALIGVSLMFVIRIIGLRAKALIVFKYLTALRAIKIHKQEYRTTLEDIERYLDDNHWTLAGYWVDHIQVEYSELFLEEVRKPASKSVSSFDQRYLF